MRIESSRLIHLIIIGSLGVNFAFIPSVIHKPLQGTAVHPKYGASFSFVRQECFHPNPRASNSFSMMTSVSEPESVQKVESSSGLFSRTNLKTVKKLLPLAMKIIPFLKTYVNLPTAIGFTLLYSSLCNRMSQANVFYSILTPFIIFFGAFAAVIYPNRAVLHPDGLADMLMLVAPSFLLPIISIFRNWTYAVFYVCAELWGSVIVSLLFWGFANEVATVAEAKAYYPLFGLLANVALIFSGQYVKAVSGGGALSGAATQGDQWGRALNWLMAAVVAGGGAILGLFTYMQRQVLTDPECVSPVRTSSGKKNKTKMSMGESASFLAKSPYIRDLALLVIGYGMSINIVEVTWKSRLQAAFPEPARYSAFMGNFSSVTGAVTLLLMLVGRFILSRFGWAVAALVPPVTLLTTGVMFFALTLFPGFFAPVAAKFGTSPLMLAVFAGAAQNIFSKGSKYAFFDPCKEMAYIPLDKESRTKGKAAVDVIGNPLGKSGGSLLQQLLIAVTGSLSASTPYLGAVLGGVILMWINAVNSLAKQFGIKSKELEEAEALSKAENALEPAT